MLDIGCGTGADALDIARTCDSARVVGIDCSRAMFERARRFAEPLGLPIRFQCADIHALPFSDGAYDGVRIDRVLHVLADPGRALREAIRVAAPGARVVVSEPDWNTLTVASDNDRLDAVMRRYFAGIDAGALGSELPGMFVAAGLDAVQARGVTLDLRDFAVISTLFDLEAVAGRAVRAGVLDAGSAVQWLRSIQAASSRGTLRATLSDVTVAGRQPASLHG